jgi:quercetin dioxygenase-like cupin family protein
MSRLSLPILILAVAAGAARSDTPVQGSRAVSWEEILGRSAQSPRQVFRAPTATLDELEMHVTTLAPGKSPHPPHKHPEEELIIIKEGQLETLLNGATQRVGPGAVIFQASNQLHGITNVGETPAVYYVIRWSSPGMLKAPAAAGAKEPRD